MSTPADRAKNAAYQRAYRARLRGDQPGRRGTRLDLVISPTTKQRLADLADAWAETEKFTIEFLIAQAHNLMVQERIKHRASTTGQITDNGE